MKRWIARRIERALDATCEATGHVGGCWLLNRSPLRRLHWWALNTAWPMQSPEAMRRAAAMLNIYGGRYGLPEHLRPKPKQEPAS